MTRFRNTDDDDGCLDMIHYFFFDILLAFLFNSCS